MIRAVPTGSFILHPLQVLQRDFGVDFDRSNYRHQVLYDEDTSCVRIYVECLRDHVLRVGGTAIELAAGERIERAVSYKYTVDDFRDLARQAGWRCEETWPDDRQWFSVHYLSAS